MDLTNPYASPQGGPLFEEPRPIEPPVTIRDTLRVATRLYFGNFLTIAAITLIFWAPLELARAYLEFFVLDYAGAFQLSLLIENVIGILPAAAVMAIGAAALKGQTPTLWLGISQGFEAWPRVFAARLTVSVMVIMALVLFIIPGLYVGIRAAFAEPVALVEGRGGMGAPRRSFELTQGHLWRTTGLVGVAYAYLLGIGILVNVPMQFVEQWLVWAAMALLLDLLVPWASLVLLAAYWGRAQAGTRSVPTT